MATRRRQLENAAEILRDLRSSRRGEMSLAQNRSLAVVARFLENMAASGLGECRLDVPYSPLRPVIDEDGTFRWCCSHKPEHCRP